VGWSEGQVGHGVGVVTSLQDPQQVLPPVAAPLEDGACGAVVVQLWSWRWYLRGDDGYDDDGVYQQDAGYDDDGVYQHVASVLVWWWWWWRRVVMQL